MTSRRDLLMTAALCLGAIAVLPFAETAQAQSRASGTYGALKQHVHRHVRMIRKLEKDRDYATLPKILDRLENLLIIEIILVDFPLGPDPVPHRSRLTQRRVPKRLSKPELPDWVKRIRLALQNPPGPRPPGPYNDLMIIVPHFIVANLHATALMAGDVGLVDDLEYLSQVMAFEGR